MDDSLNAVWKALADPTRRGILDQIRESPKTTGQLAAALPALSRYAVMKHLSTLEAAGLVVVRREGRRRYNHLNAVPLRQVYERWVTQYEDLWAGRLVGLKRTAERTAEEQAMAAQEQGAARVIRIEQEVRVAAARRVVFDAVTQSIGEWFWRGKEGALPKVRMESRVGGRFYRPGPGGTDGEGELYGIVELLEPPGRLRLLGSIGGEAATMSVIAIALEEDGQETLVRVSHRLAGEIPEGEVESYDEGWADELQSMKRFVETGKGRGA